MIKFITDGLIILGIVAVVSGLAYLCSNHEKRHQLNCHTKQIRAVGGCSSGGRCGVLFDDGSAGDREFPVVGKVVCAD